MYDLTESSADSSLCKRQKRNSTENDVIELLDDECSNDLLITYVNIGPRKKPCILFCGFETEVEEELKQVFFCFIFIIIYVYDCFKFLCNV